MDTHLATVRTEAKVFHGLSGVLWTSKQQCVRSRRRPESELIQSQSLTTSLFNPGSGGRSEAEGSNRQLWDREEAVVICDRSDNNNGLALVRLGNIGDNARERDRRTVDARHKKAAKHYLVEIRIRAACQMILISLCLPHGVPAPHN